MPFILRSWWNEVRHRRRRRIPGRRWMSRRFLSLEYLEPRTLLSGATLQAARQSPLTFNSLDTVHVAGSLTSPQGVELYAVSLHAGDRLNAAVTAQTAGSGLQSLLRVFDSSGQQLALDDQEGGDPQLTFQAATAGDYFLGVSSAPNDNYDPNVANSGTGGGTTGLYTLDVRRTEGAPLQADLTGSSFRLGVETAAWGEQVPVDFTIENRGGAYSGAVKVEVLLGYARVLNPFALMHPLAVFPVPSLAPGAASSPGPSTITLPDPTTAPVLGLPPSGPISVGLLILPQDSSQDALPPSFLLGPRGTDWEPLTLVTPVPDGVTDLAQADPSLNTRVEGTLPVHQSTRYLFTVPTPGQFTATVLSEQPETFLPRLTLSGEGGQLLLTSDSGRLVQSLPPGTYSLDVSSAAGAGSYQLTTEFLPATPASEGLPVESNPVGLAVADVDGDGNLDLIDTNYGTSSAPGNTASVLLGNGDGSFQGEELLQVGSLPSAVAVADVNGDGLPDLLVASRGDSTVSVLLSDGGGNFQLSQTCYLGSAPFGVAVADVNGDGHLDIITSNSGAGANDGTATVLLGNGDGTFQDAPDDVAQHTFNVGPNPRGVTVADINGDGIPDILTADYGFLAAPGTINVLASAGHTVSVLLGNGDGTFGGSSNPVTGRFAGTARAVTVGTFPSAVAVADVNGDGKADLVVANSGTYSNPGDTLSILLGNGDGSFQAPRTLAVGARPVSLAVADVNGDGLSDLVCANESSDTVSVLLGHGDGTFEPQQVFPVGQFPSSVSVADINHDGRPDLAVANRGSGTLSVLLGNGDGSFQDRQGFDVGRFPSSVAVADLNGDGRPDLIVPNTGNFGAPDRTVSVLLNNGDGSFQPQQTFAVGKGPSSVVAADLNGDGRLDLVVTNSQAGTVSVLLGNGDGSFQDTPDYLKAHTFALNAGPVAVAVVDVNGDGKLDVVWDVSPNGQTVGVLLGNGDGSFGSPESVSLDTLPPAVAEAAFTTYLEGLSPAVTLVDVNGDGHPDRITTNDQAGTVTVQLARAVTGTSTFALGPVQYYHVGAFPTSVTVADVNGDGFPDLVATNENSGTVTVLLNKGDGTFQDSPGYLVQHTFPVGTFPLSVTVVDVNGDGRPDLAVADAGSNTVSVLLGKGDGTFLPATPATGVDQRSTPYLADLDGDGLPDSVVLDHSGNILFRKGVVSTSNPFAPPVVINPHLPARDLTVLRTATGWIVAAADTNGAVSLYRWGNGAFYNSATFSLGPLPQRIAAGDLTGNGLDDLVVANGLDNSVRVAFQKADGSFSLPLTLTLGEAPSDMALVDVNGDGLSDIVVSNQASGDVSVFLNDPGHSFATSYRFRAGLGLYGLDTTSSTPTVTTLAESVSLAVGDFTGNGRNDLVVVNRGSHSISLLANDGTGGFADPQTALTTSTSDGLAINDQPGPVVAADFNRDGKADLAVLMEDRSEVWIYTNQGSGTFVHTGSFAVGDQPTGLSVVPDPATGLSDLLVGDQFGDVVLLQSKGDGTFQPPRPRGAPLNVTVLPGSTTPAALVADQEHDVVKVQSVGSDTVQPLDVTSARANAPLAPGAVQWMRLEDGNGPADPIVTASGSNQVLVYHTRTVDPATGLPTFYPVSPSDIYNVGDDPVGVTFADLNGDHIPDMIVTNRGSNDVSILFGSLNSSTGLWQGIPGPRLRSGGIGPMTVRVIADAASPGGQDLAILNGQSGTLNVLPGRGLGFFNDNTPQILNIPGNPTIVSAQDGFLVTSTGSIIDSNTANFPTVFTSPANDPVVFAAPFTPKGARVPELFVARADGFIEMLTSDTGSSYAEAEISTSTVPNPSEVAVFSEGGELDVLATQEGSDQIFTLSLGIPVVALSAPSNVAVGELQPLPSSEVPVVPVLALQGQESDSVLAVTAEQTGDDPVVQEVNAALSDSTQEETTAAESVTDDDQVLVAAALGGDDGGDGATDRAPANQDVTPFVSGDQDTSQPDTPPTLDDLQSPDGKGLPNRTSPDPLAPVESEEAPTSSPQGTDSRLGSEKGGPPAAVASAQADVSRLPITVPAENPVARAFPNHDREVLSSEGGIPALGSPFIWRDCPWEDERVMDLASNLLVAALLMNMPQLTAEVRNESTSVGTGRRVLPEP